MVLTGLPLAYGYRRLLRFSEAERQLFIGAGLLGLLGWQCVATARGQSFRLAVGKSQLTGLGFVGVSALGHGLCRIADAPRVVELLVVSLLWPTVAAAGVRGAGRPVVVAALVASALVQSALAWAQFCTAPTHRSLATVGTLFNAGILGNYLGLLLPWLMGLCWEARRLLPGEPARRGPAHTNYWFLLGASLLVAGALLLTSARAAWLGALVGGGLVVLHAAGRTRRAQLRHLLRTAGQTWRGGALGALGLRGSALALAALLHLKQASVAGRWQIYCIGAGLFRQHPWQGIGWGQAAVAFNEKQAAYFSTRAAAAATAGN